MCAHLLLSEHVSMCILNIALSFKYIRMLCACVHACSLLERTQVCVCVFGRLDGCLDIRIFELQLVLDALH